VFLRGTLPKLDWALPRLSTPSRAFDRLAAPFDGVSPARPECQQAVRGIPFGKIAFLAGQGHSLLSAAESARAGETGAIRRWVIEG
jgi:hypothetical protein